MCNKVMRRLDTTGLVGPLYCRIRTPPENDRSLVFAGSNEVAAYVERASTFFQLATLLKRLAFTYNLAVVVTNQAREKMMSNFRLKPAKLQKFFYAFREAKQQDTSAL